MQQNRYYQLSINIIKQVFTVFYIILSKKQKPKFICIGLSKIVTLRNRTSNQ